MRTILLALIAIGFIGAGLNAIIPGDNNDKPPTQTDIKANIREDVGTAYTVCERRNPDVVGRRFAQQEQWADDYATSWPKRYRSRISQACIEGLLEAELAAD